MGQRSSSPVQVQGTVDPGFESVKEMFERNFARGAEESAQLCVYVEDRKVVKEVSWDCQDQGCIGDLFRLDDEPDVHKWVCQKQGGR